MKHGERRGRDGVGPAGLKEEEDAAFARTRQAEQHALAWRTHIHAAGPEIALAALDGAAAHVGHRPPLQDRAWPLVRLNEGLDLRMTELDWAGGRKVAARDATYRVRLLGQGGPEGRIVGQGAAQGSL